MTVFIVTMTHPDGEGWGRHVAAHVRYLEAQIAAGTLRASGPLKGMPKRAGFLIFEAGSRAQVEALVRADPFAAAGIIESLTIEEWDPIFGAFAAASSGRLAGYGAVG